MLVARVLVTPTRVHALPPEVETSNRVWRAYRAHTHRFLRVTFCDENGKRLCFASSAKRLSDFYKRCACTAPSSWHMTSVLDLL